jgi:hypothetical protein
VPVPVPVPVPVAVPVPVPVAVPVVRAAPRRICTPPSDTLEGVSPRPARAPPAYSGLALKLRRSLRKCAFEVA